MRLLVLGGTVFLSATGTRTAASATGRPGLPGSVRTGRWCPAYEAELLAAWDAAADAR